MSQKKMRAIGATLAMMGALWGGGAGAGDGAGRQLLGAELDAPVDVTIKPTRIPGLYYVDTHVEPIIEIDNSASGIRWRIRNNKNAGPGTCEYKKLKVVVDPDSSKWKELPKEWNNPHTNTPTKCKFMDENDPDGNGNSEIVRFKKTGAPPRPACYFAYALQLSGVNKKSGCPDTVTTSDPWVVAAKR